MKKGWVKIIVLSIFLFSGMEISFAANRVCPAPQAGYQCYCPTDVTLDCGYIPVATSSNPASFQSSAVGGGVTQAMLQVGGGNNSANAGTNVTLQGNFLRNIQTYIMGLLGIVTVGIFLYIGYTLFTAQGKEEDFKNAWKALIYAVIGLAVIPLGYIVVKIVTGFTF
ncbi:MAG: pilin [Candidatus Gracilibacteria bacterium]|jgi:hypothetical protein